MEPATHDMIDTFYDDNELKNKYPSQFSSSIPEGIADGSTFPSSLPPRSSFYMQISFLAILCTLVQFDYLGISIRQDPVDEPQYERLNNATSLNEILDRVIRTSIPSPKAIKENVIREKNPLALNTHDLFEIFPLPAHKDTIQIYNDEAYIELINTLSSKNMSITVNGGSSSAGGGSIEAKNRYYRRFVNFLEELRNDTSLRIGVTDRSHGGRHSLHSAVFSPNLLPPGTDLLFWEFAINDFAYHHDGGSEENRIQQERSMMIAWLREVEKMEPKPPKVILIYLWKGPFDIDEDKNIVNPVFESHSLKALAKEFDFIVGHVNVAAYLDEQKTMSFEDKKSLVLSDRTHPNNIGHLITSFLLLNLLKGTGKWSNSIDRDNTNYEADTVEKYTWFCGNNTKNKRFVRDRIVQSDDETSSGWRSPLGALTLEKPFNEYIRPGSKQLILASNELKKVLGKQDPVRGDRQGSVSIACCNQSIRGNYTSISIPKKTEPMRNVQAVFLGMGIGFSDMNGMKVYIDSNKEHAKGRLIRVPHSWPCFWNWRDVYDTWWFAFSEEQSKVSTMDFCVENDKCEDNEQSDALLIAMAAYA